jgi:hypothetical protein
VFRLFPQFLVFTLMLKAAVPITMGDFRLKRKSS